MNKNNIYLLSNQSYEGVINLPVIQIQYHKINIKLASFQALIFSSKNAVLAIDQETQEWKSIPAYCIGEGTASKVLELGGNVVFTCKNSYGDIFAKEIATKLKGKKALFLRAKKVLSNLEDILLDRGVKLSSQVIYETTCKEQKVQEFEKNSLFIFTSPSTIECFFKHYFWDDSYKAICIGTVTAKHLPSYITPYLSEQQSIQECIKLALSLK